MIDRNTMQAVEAFAHCGSPPEGGAALLIEVEGLREETEDEAAAILAICEEGGAREVRTGHSAEERERLWAGRKNALGALGRLAPSYYILDGVVPRTKLPEGLGRVYPACEREGVPLRKLFTASHRNLQPQPRL